MSHFLRLACFFSIAALSFFSLSAQELESQSGIPDLRELPKLDPNAENIVSQFHQLPPPKHTKVHQLIIERTLELQEQHKTLFEGTSKYLLLPSTRPFFLCLRLRQIPGITKDSKNCLLLGGEKNCFVAA